MIGMSQIKKRLFYGIAIGAGIGLLGVILTLVWAMNIVKGYEKGTNKNFMKNYMVNATVLTRDVLQGEKITDDIVTTVQIHKATAPAEAVVAVAGKIAKYNIPKNIPIVNNMIGDDIVTADVRIQEISSVLLPTNLNEKQFVDFRIKYPSGVEYSVIVQKQIQKVAGTTIWVNLSEAEIHLLNSAMVDAYMNEGTVLYAVEYADPQSQIKVDKNTELKAQDFLAKKIVADMETNKKYTNAMSEQVTKKATENVTPAEESSNLEEPVATEAQVTSPTGQLTPQQIADQEVYNEFRTNIGAIILQYALDYRYFVESYNKVEANYQPNKQVIDHMIGNKNIVKQAQDKLNADVRNSMELRLKSFKDENKDTYDNLVSGVNTSVAAQKQLRTAAITAQPQ